MHKALEHYVLTGEIDRTSETGSLAGRIAPYVSRWVQNPLARTETHFTLLGKYATWQGYKDLEVPGEIIDYKTVGNLTYAKSAEDLQGDPQAILYAEDHFRRFGGDVVKLSWLYVQKRAPHRFLPIHGQMTRDHAQKAFAALDSFAAEALALDAATEDAMLQVPGNYTFCEAYGGCPYRSKCGRHFNFGDFS